MEQESTLRVLPKSVPVYDKRFYLTTKRLLDIVISFALLILLSPLLFLIAVWIRLDSPGPVIFAQTRVGHNRRLRDRRKGRQSQTGAMGERRLAKGRRIQDTGGRPFTMYKFRTMHCGSDTERHQRYMESFILNHVTDGESGGGLKGSLFKLVQDPRVTPFGRILRKTSLDELPQLINVLKGDMSLVGPRPELPYAVMLYDEWHRRRLRVLPGITGWWQVQGRSQVPFDEAVRMDIYYVEHSSLLLDLKILLLTPWAALSCRGAG